MTSISLAGGGCRNRDHFAVLDRSSVLVGCYEFGSREGEKKRDA